MYQVVLSKLAWLSRLFFIMIIGFAPLGLGLELIKTNPDRQWPHFAIFLAGCWALFFSYRFLLKHDFICKDKELWTWKFLAVVGLLYILIRVIDELGYHWLNQSNIETTVNQTAIMADMKLIHPLNVFLNAVILGPIVEEIVFRGIIFKKLMPKWPLVALIVSTCLFALSHIPEHPAEWLIYGSSGFLFGLVYYKTGRLEYSLVGHVFNNFVVFLLTSV